MKNNESSISNYKEKLETTIDNLDKNFEYEFNMSLSNGYSVTSRSGEVENIEHHQDMALNVSVYKDFQKGSASTNDLSDSSIDQAIEKAQNISMNTQADECQGLPDSQYTTKKWENMDIYFPKELDINNIIELTRNCENSAFQTDKRVTNSEGSSFTFSNNSHMILNSNGAFGTYDSTDYSLSCIALAEQEKLMERDYWYSSTRNFDELESSEHIGAKAAERVISRLGAKTIKTQVCPVLFSPEMTSSLISSFLSAINGSSIYKKSSFLIDKINKKVFPEFINISEDPSLPNGSGTRPYDSEGVLTQKKDIIKEGILKTYLLDTYAARKLNETCTGNGVLTNILVTSKQPSSSLLESMPDGLYITDMMGSGANTLTGDYSRGAFGYLVKNGEIQYPVTEITVASNLLQMFENIIALGDDIDSRNRIRTGSMLIDNITIGGQ